MIEAMYSNYELSFKKAVDILKAIYRDNFSLEDNELRKLLVSEYKRLSLDSDGKAIRYYSNIKCTADGLHSMLRICILEAEVEDIIKTYEKFRKVPIFFFPCERGGINSSRNRVFGDRIDHTLYDLKMYYTGNRNQCKLFTAYSLPITKEWLDSLGSFEKLIDWLGVKGIFTDEDYNVYDLESCESVQVISSYNSKLEYQRQWPIDYYNNLKEKITLYYNALFGRFQRCHRQMSCNNC